MCDGSAVTPDERYQQWLEWFKQIRNETHTIFLYRDYWRGLAEMTQANPDIPPSSIFPALDVWYVAVQATSVRRQLDRDRRAVSFANLLADMAEHPEVMTRSRHVTLWGKDELFRHEGERNFDGFAGERSDVVEPARTLADLERLRDVAKPIITLVNKAIAHSEEKHDAVATYAELDSAIDSIGELLQEYSSLLMAVALPELVPIDQDDWRLAFTVPWWKRDAPPGPPTAGS